jgi:chemotaxis protein MotB
MPASNKEGQFVYIPSASGQASELGFEQFDDDVWNNVPDASKNSHQEAWVISYIDILTLLLTLFVILLAMSDFRPDISSLKQVSVNINKPENQNMPADSGDEMQAYKQTEEISFVQDLAESKTHEHRMTPSSHEQINVLISEIKKSRLDHQIEISEDKDHVNLVISDKILFSPGSADLKSGGLELLSQLAVLINNSKLNMSIEGHTDSVPINNAHFLSNWELSSARATLVTRQLIANDIAPNRIRAIGYADTRPRSENDTPEGRKHNRRVSIVLHMPEPDTQLDALVGIRQ